MNAEEKRDGTIVNLEARIVRCPICGWRFDGGPDVVDSSDGPHGVLVAEAERAGVEVEAVRGHHRAKVLVAVRRRIARILAGKGYSRAQIAAVLNRDRSTISNLVLYD